MTETSQFLTPEQRDAVVRRVRAAFASRRGRNRNEAAGASDIKGIADRLCVAIAKDIEHYYAQQCNDPDELWSAKTRDDVRTLVAMARDDDPPVAAIRLRIKALPPAAIHYLEQRAERLWPRLVKEWVQRGLLAKETPTEPPRGGFVEWCQTAESNVLCDAMDAVIVEGGQRVEVTTRSVKRPMKTVLQPMICGIVPGAGADSPRQLVGGRPAQDAAYRLVQNLALSWRTCLAVEPRRNRTDSTGFAGLVHDVFQWLELENAEQALRHYWDLVKTAEITEIEGGLIVK
jgi:hypothetical protein